MKLGSSVKLLERTTKTNPISVNKNFMPDICAMETKTSYPKEKINVLLLENISEIAVKNFQRNGYTQVQRLSKALPEKELIDAIKNVHILGIRSKTQITPAVLEAASRLQTIGCFCIGTNQVDLKRPPNRE